MDQKIQKLLKESLGFKPLKLNEEKLQKTRYSSIAENYMYIMNDYQNLKKECLVAHYESNALVKPTNTKSFYTGNSARDVKLNLKQKLQNTWFMVKKLMYKFIELIKQLWEKATNGIMLLERRIKKLKSFSKWVSKHQSAINEFRHREWLTRQKMTFEVAIPTEFKFSFLEVAKIVFSNKSDTEKMAGANVLNTKLDNYIKHSKEEEKLIDKLMEIDDNGQTLQKVYQNFQKRLQDEFNRLKKIGGISNDSWFNLLKSGELMTTIGIFDRKEFKKELSKYEEFKMSDEDIKKEYDQLSDVENNFSKKFNKINEDLTNWTGLFIVLSGKIKLYQMLYKDKFKARMKDLGLDLFGLKIGAMGLVDYIIISNAVVKGAESSIAQYKYMNQIFKQVKDISFNIRNVPDSYIIHLDQQSLQKTRVLVNDSTKAMWYLNKKHNLKLKSYSSSISNMLSTTTSKKIKYYIEYATNPKVREAAKKANEEE